MVDFLSSDPYYQASDSGLARFIVPSHTMRIIYILVICIGVAFLAIYACQQIGEQAEDGALTSLEAGMDQSGFQTISPRRAQELLDKNNRIVLLDVRTPAEYYEGHLKDAVLLDVTQEEEFKKHLADMDPSTPVIVYCRSGNNRSTKACRLLREAGVSTVYNVEGGYLAWPQPE